MAKKGKLTPEEIERTVQAIRDRYNDYIIRYTKPPSVKKGFEDRFFQARRMNIDLTNFLFAELNMIKELISREEEKKESAQVRNEIQEKREKQKAEKSFADKILEQNRERIAKYPEIDLPLSSSYEIKKLFGMLRQFDKDYWPDFSALFRTARNSISFEVRSLLETTEAELALGRGDGLPPVLHRYRLLLSSKPKDWKRIEIEEKNCILNVAFFLHRVRAATEKVLKADEVAEERRKGVEKSLDFLHSVLTDFRLKDLKPQGLEEQ